MNQPDWTNFVNNHHADSLPNQSEVENALGKAYPNDTIEINSIELLVKSTLRVKHTSLIHLTLAMNIEKKSPKSTFTLLEMNFKT